MKNTEVFQGTPTERLKEAETTWQQLRPAVEECMSKAQKACVLLATKSNTSAVPDSLKQQLESLVTQLVSTTKQLSSQFEVAYRSADKIRDLQESIQQEIVVEQKYAWSNLTRIGILENADLLRYFHRSPFPNHTTYLYHSHCPRNLQLALRDRDFHACKLLEKEVLLPKRVAAITEVGCGFGLRTLVLSRMARIGAIEPQSKLFNIAKTINSSAIENRSAGLKISFDGAPFLPETAFQFPVDAFDLVYFSRTAWKKWAETEDNLLLAALTELSHKCHFLFFTSPVESLLKRELIEMAFDLRELGQLSNGESEEHFFLATRRFISFANSFIPVFDIRLHDPGWQGWENLDTPPSNCPSSASSSPLITPRRILIGFGQFIETYLARALPTEHKQQHPKNLQSELNLWKSFGGSLPVLPRLVETHTDSAGHHFVFQTPHTALKLPQPPFTIEERRCLVSTALRILKHFRQNNLFLNFLRLPNFILSNDVAYLTTLNRTSSIEEEDHIAALLWFLHDLGTDKIYWHEWPIERFDPYKASAIPSELIPLASIAVKCADIDEFLTIAMQTPQAY